MHGHLLSDQLTQLQFLHGTIYLWFFKKALKGIAQSYGDL